MEDPPGEADSSHDFSPYSARELVTIHAELNLAGSEVEKKQTLTRYGMTTDDAREYFRGYPGFDDE